MATLQQSFQQQIRRATSGERKPRSAAAATHGSSACLRSLQGDRQIVVANEGDHPLIAELLSLANQSDLRDDFQSRLDEPRYLASDRLLLRQAGEVIGHVQVSKVFGWFHGQRYPLARLQDFVSPNRSRTDGSDSALLEAAESAAMDEGAVLGLVRTGQPQWFEQHGWSCCQGQGHSQASTWALLSLLEPQQQKQQHPRPTFEVRTWRHFEIDSLRRIYQQLSVSMWGAKERSLEYWQWLVGRKAHDQILIAVEPSSPPSLLLKAGRANLSRGLNILGYAVVRDSCIVEMLTLPGHVGLRAALVAQACREAIDRDHHHVSLHTPADDPMHELMVTAGGTWLGNDSSERWVLKLLSPERWIERLYPVLHERARAAGLKRPLEIDFAVGKQLWRFSLTRRSCRLEKIRRSAVAVQCRWQTLQNLLSSNLTYPEAIARGRLRSSQGRLLRVLSALFPPQLLWQSPFPQLRI